MRTLLVILFLVIFAIISIPLYLVEFIIGKFDEKLRTKSSQAIVKGAFQIILFLSGTKVIVKGKERVPQNEAVLFVANHRGNFDIVIAYATTPHLTGFVAKKQMAHIPCINHWMRLLHCLFLDRENIREGLKTILQGIEYIKSGYSMYIAPEGTRHQGKEMLPFKEGSFKLAEKSGCPIIPVSISNTEAIFENHSPWIRRATAVIEYGEPIYLNNLPKEERKFIGKHVQAIIKDTLEKNESLF